MKTIFLSGMMAPRIPMRAPSPRLGVSAGSIRLSEAGPLIEVEVGQPNSVIESMKAQGRDIPPSTSLVALIDTGASISAINADIAQQLGLLQTGAVPIGGVGGVREHPVYAAALRIPGGPEYGAVQLIGAYLQQQMLIGRDILCSMTLVYDGLGGAFRLS